MRIADLDIRCARIRASWLVLIIIMSITVLLFSDSGIMHMLNGSFLETDLHIFTRLVTDYVKFLFYLFFLGLIAYGRLNKRFDLTHLAYAYLIAQLLGSALLVQILKFLVGRPRPSTNEAWASIEHWIGPSLRSAFHSFPSGHTADLFTSAIFISLLLRKRRSAIIFLYIALLVGLTRIVLKDHYPTDVIAGAIIGGYISLLVIQYWLRPRLNKMEQDTSRQADQSLGEQPQQTPLYRAQQLQDETTGNTGNH